MTDDTRRMVEEAMRRYVDALEPDGIRVEHAVDVAVALVEKERATIAVLAPATSALLKRAETAEQRAEAAEKALAKAQADTVEADILTHDIGKDRDAAVKAFAEARERLAEMGKYAEEMRACPGSMCGHCIEVLCEEILPRCAPPPAAEPMPERCGTCDSDNPRERLPIADCNCDRIPCDNDAFHSQPPAGKETRDGE